MIVVQEEPTSTGTGYDTDGQFAFTVYNNSDYDIYSLHMVILDAGSDHDIDVLPQILPANISTTITGQASMGDWIQTDWTIYVTDVDGDTSASYDTFNPIASNGLSPERMSVAEKMRIAQILEEEGVLNVKGAVAEIARQLGVSTPTVYRYLNKSRED